MPSHSSSNNDQCEHCQSTYSLSKRKKNCAVCRQSYCSNCAPRERHRTPSYRICLICQLISSDGTSDDQLLALKVKHLRCFLQAKNISHHTCTEKRELVDLIVRHRHAPFTRLLPPQSSSPPPPPPSTEPPKSTPLNNFQQTMSTFASQMNHFAANLQDYVSNTVSGVLHQTLTDPSASSSTTTTTTTTTTTNNLNGTSTTINFGTSSTAGPFTYTFNAPNNFVYTTTTTTTTSNPPVSRVTTNQPSNVNKRRRSISELKDEQNIEDLNIRDLKEILAANFVDFKGCVEKSELIEKVRRLYRDRQNEKRKAKELDSATASDSELCKVCMDAIADCVFLDCGHMVTCVKCGKLLAECPICRSNIVRVVRVFKS